MVDKVEACMKEVEQLEAKRKSDQNAFSDEIYDFENVKSDGPNVATQIKEAYEEYAKAKKTYDDTKKEIDALNASIGDEKSSVYSHVGRYNKCTLKPNVKRIDLNVQV